MNFIALGSPPLCPIFLHFQSFVKGSRTRLLLGGENGARRVLRCSVGAIEVRHDDMGLYFDDFFVCADDNPLPWPSASACFAPQKLAARLADQTSILSPHT